MLMLLFSIDIQAPRAVVWEKMLGDEGYRHWTSAFCEGSYFEGGWEKGDSIRFLTPTGDGMYSRIIESKRFEKVTIEHLGDIVDGMQGADAPEGLSWAGALERYKFSETGGRTRVEIEVSCAEPFHSFMLDAWPKALAKLKESCE